MFNYKPEIVERLKKVETYNAEWDALYMRLESTSKKTLSADDQKLFTRIISDRDWRILGGRWYKLKTKGAKIEYFKPWLHQVDFYVNLHYYSVVLKARQLGLTTLCEILMLDEATWSKNKTIFTISLNVKKAAESLKRIKSMYWNFDESIRALFPLGNEDNVGTFSFANGSVIRAGDRMRGSSIQLLHVTELGEIAVDQPEKAQEIITGGSAALAPGGVWIVESTAKGNYGAFYDMVVDAMANKDRKVSPGEPRLYFYPWWTIKEYAREGEIEELTDETIAYFASLKKKLPDVVFSLEQMLWYQDKKKTFGYNMKREFPSLEEEAFEATLEGAYFKVELEKLRSLGYHMSPLEYDTRKPVYFAQDIGSARADIFLFQVDFSGNKLYSINILHWRRLSGWYTESIIEGIVKKLQREKGYKDIRFFLPHDGEKKSDTDGLNPKRTIERAGYRVKVMKKYNSVYDKIGVAKKMLPYMHIDPGALYDTDEKNNKVELLATLMSFTEKIAANGMGMGVPDHNDASHTGDALCYVAQAVEGYLLKGSDAEHFQLLSYDNRDAREE